MAMRSCSVVSIGFFVSTFAPGSGDELDAWLLDCLMVTQRARNKKVARCAKAATEP